jgi:hypothetical protein
VKLPKKRQIPDCETSQEKQTENCQGLEKHYKDLSGMNQRVSEIGLWIRSKFFQISNLALKNLFSSQFQKIMSNKVKTIRNSKEANLSCQIAANQFSNFSSSKITAYLKLYKEELTKCVQHTDDIRRILYCRICDNNSSQFFKKDNQQLYFKVRPHQCSTFIDKCSGNLYLLNFFMRKIFIVYKLATCSSQG